MWTKPIIQLYMKWFFSRQTKWEWINPTKTKPWAVYSPPHTQLKFTVDMFIWNAMKRQCNCCFKTENFFLLLYSGYKDWNDELPATLCTLNFNSSINAYNASHFTLAAVGYDVFVYLERFVI